MLGKPLRQNCVRCWTLPKANAGETAHASGQGRDIWVSWCHYGWFRRIGEHHGVGLDAIERKYARGFVHKSAGKLARRAHVGVRRR
ncbi:hypothetical protein BURKHO8Y_210112 [Burkholderia sp. 8Y]|nr:hypothetical protein BURKHO8Y_210112 [Burkholderia sp. 8Y]